MEGSVYRYLAAMGKPTCSFLIAQTLQHFQDKITNEIFDKIWT